LHVCVQSRGIYYFGVERPLSSTVKHVILWDFDGTLAYRPGMWGRCVLSVLDETEPGHTFRREDLSPLLRYGFPWHDHERAHPELCEPSAWWEHLEGVLSDVFQLLGYPSTRAKALARSVHRRYLEIDAWRTFDDTMPVLELLRDRGWNHVILSNHVPELSEIVAGLGLNSVIDTVITSAATAYEKPHPQAFAAALDMIGTRDRLWMVGDNPVADIQGAEAAGIPAILVRSRSTEEVRHVAGDLWDVAALLT
jgi:putative hydrolase of the HAD superfamily